ncbi:hypothetical protein P20480_0190 [Pseudoalteromonas sp. BSi20480]|nr:hypothetical protein P20480_0190 [Pseudoalteromonas sp. BSi20480]
MDSKTKNDKVKPYFNKIRGGYSIASSQIATLHVFINLLD